MVDLVKKEELTQVQPPPAVALKQLRQTFVMYIDSLRVRCGVQTEAAYLQEMRTILQEIGFATERFVAYDVTGEIFGWPGEEVELDVVTKGARTTVLEIRHSLDWELVHVFNYKVRFYTQQTGRSVDRKLIVTPFIDDRAQNVARRLGVEICTDVTGLS